MNNVQGQPFPGFSLEFFPPKTEDGKAHLRSAWNELKKLSPDFCSVTFGAGGSTKQGTLDTVLAMREDGLNAVPHLSCVGASRDQILSILETYKAKGIHRIVALRGDLPSGMGEIGELRYAADLVAFIRQKTGDWFHIDVAAYPEGHPQAKSFDHDVKYFKHKVETGANSAITQYFFNADAYFHFVDRCSALGVSIPVLPGIMPIMSFSKIMRFSEGCGAEIPKWVREQMQSYGDDSESIREFGLDVVTKLCERLLSGGAPGIHFYTMNSPALTVELCKRLAGKFF